MSRVNRRRRRAPGVRDHHALKTLRTLVAEPRGVGAGLAERQVTDETHRYSAARRCLGALQLDRNALLEADTRAATFGSDPQHLRSVRHHSGQRFTRDLERSRVAPDALTVAADRLRTDRSSDQPVPGEPNHRVRDLSLTNARGGDDLARRRARVLLNVRQHQEIERANGSTAARSFHLGDHQTLPSAMRCALSCRTDHSVRPISSSTCQRTRTTESSPRCSTNRSGRTVVFNPGDTTTTSLPSDVTTRIDDPSPTGPTVTSAPYSGLLGSSMTRTCAALASSSARRHAPDHRSAPTTPCRSKTSESGSPPRTASSASSVVSSARW